MSVQTLQTLTQQNQGKQQKLEEKQAEIKSIQDTIQQLQKDNSDAQKEQELKDQDKEKGQREFSSVIQLMSGEQVANQVELEHEKQKVTELEKEEQEAMYQKAVGDGDIRRENVTLETEVQKILTETQKLTSDAAHKTLNHASTHEKEIRDFSKRCNKATAEAFKRQETLADAAHKQVGLDATTLDAVTKVHEDKDKKLAEVEHQIAIINSQIAEEKVKTEALATQQVTAVQQRMETYAAQRAEGQSFETMNKETVELQAELAGLERKVKAIETTRANKLKDQTKSAALAEATATKNEAEVMNKTMAGNAREALAHQNGQAAIAKVEKARLEIQVLVNKAQGALKAQMVDDAAQISALHKETNEMDKDITTSKQLYRKSRDELKDTSSQLVLAQPSAGHIVPMTGMKVPDAKKARKGV